MLWVIGLGIWIAVSAIVAPWVGSFIDGQRPNDVRLTQARGSVLAPRKRS
jgi:hypothetical protein